MHKYAFDKYAFVSKSLKVKYVSVGVFCRTYAEIQFHKICRIQKYEYAFPKYEWKKGKYAHI